MSRILALCSAALFGMGDFLGGLSARRAPVWAVLAWSQGIGAPILVVGVAVVGFDSVGPADLGYGALAGLLGVVGLALLYRTLAAGTMSVAAPMVGAISAVIPVMWSVVGGSSPGGVEWLGIGAAVFGVLLLGSSAGSAAMSRSVVGLALGAGLAFGLFYVAFGETSDDAGLWPLVAARCVSIPAAALITSRLHNGRPRGRTTGLVAGAGVLDVTATILLTLALQRGPVGINAVLSSLFPVFTALIAIVFLRERPTVRQAIGIGMALAAALLLAG